MVAHERRNEGGPPETIGWIWTKVFFHPGRRGTEDELWGVHETGEPTTATEGTR